MNINVPSFSFSDDIMKYVCLKAEPVKHHGAHPRLSLYLSSQLMFGVAKVYEKQIDYFSGKYTYNLK